MVCVYPSAASHGMIFAQPCMQVSAKLPLPDEDDPHPWTVPSAKPTARNDPITAETVFLDIARYLLCVCEGRKVSRLTGRPCFVCDDRALIPLRRLGQTHFQERSGGAG